MPANLEIAISGDFEAHELEAALVKYVGLLGADVEGERGLQVLVYAALSLAILVLLYYLRPHTLVA